MFYILFLLLLFCHHTLFICAHYILVDISKGSSEPVSPRKAQVTTIKGKSKGPRRKITLRDTPLSEEELRRPRKTQYAKMRLLQRGNLARLYKCLEKNCAFATDHRRSFESHLQHHPQLKEGKNHDKRWLTVSNKPKAE